MKFQQFSEILIQFQAFQLFSDILTRSFTCSKISFKVFIWATLTTANTSACSIASTFVNVCWSFQFVNDLPASQFARSNAQIIQAPRKRIKRNCKLKQWNWTESIAEKNFPFFLFTKLTKWNSIFFCWAQHWGIGFNFFSISTKWYWIVFFAVSRVRVHEKQKAP